MIPKELYDDDHRVYKRWGPWVICNHLTEKGSSWCVMHADEKKVRVFGLHHFNMAVTHPSYICTAEKDVWDYILMVESDRYRMV